MPVQKVVRVFWFFGFFVLALPGTQTPAMAGDPKCEIDRPVVFADLNWESNQLHSQIAKFIVERG